MTRSRAAVIANTESFVWLWRRTVASAAGPTNPTARHVLLTLSLFMNSDGGSCFPSTTRLAQATGLSERSVCTHLQAMDGTWIERRAKAGRGKQWKLFEYRPIMPEALNHVQHQPDGMALNDVQHPNPEGTEARSAPSKALKQVQQHGAEVLNLVQNGTEPDDSKALNHVQSTSTVTSPVTSTTKEAAAAAVVHANGKTRSIDHSGSDHSVFQREMHEAVEYAAAEKPVADRPRFTAAGRALADELDVTAWRNPRDGSLVAWSDRPRLLKLALALLAAGERRSPRSALRLALQQQLDPFPAHRSEPSKDSRPGAPTDQASRRRRSWGDDDEARTDTTSSTKGDDDFAHLG